MTNDAEAHPLDPRVVTETIRAWWAGMADRDIDAVGRLVADTCVFFGGPQGRESGRTAFLATAQAFFSTSVIHDWWIDQIQIDMHGDTAVGTYHWGESGTHDGAPFQLDGIATDVYERTADGWTLIARHVGPGDATAGERAES